MSLARLLMAAMAGFICATAAMAEPATPPGDEISAIKLDYAERPGKEGRFAAAEVIVSGPPVRYYVRGTNISAPFSVQIIAASTSRPLDVTLHRQNWGKPVQSGSTGQKGVYAFEGRAFGDVGVQLASATGQPARATIVFWEGLPAPPSMATVYTNPDLQAAAPRGARQAGGGAGSEPGWILYAIAGLLAVIVVFLGLMLMRRGKNGAAALFLAGSLAAAGLNMPDPALAQEPVDPPGNPFLRDPAPKSGEDKPDEPEPDEVPNPFDVDKPLPDVPRDKDKDASAGKPDEVPNPFDVDKPPSGTPRDKDKDASAGKPDDKPDSAPDDKSGKTDPGSRPKDDPVPGEAPSDDGYAGRLADAERRIEDLSRQASANRAEIERLKMLQESDRKMEPDPANLPPMPLTCRPPAVESAFDEEMSAAWDNYDACEACYREPFRNLDELLLNYERLRIIYMSTADFVSTAITMGDTVPKPHQFVEMSWAQQKADIQKSFQGTKDAYDAKWAEFNDQMTAILDELGTCEAEFNNNPNWRSTEGEMFYRTIRASYQRTN